MTTRGANGLLLNYSAVPSIFPCMPENESPLQTSTAPENSIVNSPITFTVPENSVVNLPSTSAIVTANSFDSPTLSTLPLTKLKNLFHSPTKALDPLTAGICLIFNVNV